MKAFIWRGTMMTKWQYAHATRCVLGRVPGSPKFLSKDRKGGRNMKAVDDCRNLALLWESNGA